MLIVISVEADTLLQLLKGGFFVPPLQELCERAGKPMPPAPYKSLQNTRFKNFKGTCPCEVLHPGQSCNGFMLNFFPDAYLRSPLMLLLLHCLPACSL